MVILRKTYGWDKKEDQISNSQFSESTGIMRKHIPRILKKLLSRNIIYRVSPIQGTGVPHSGDRYIISYGFQKNFDEWVRCPLNRGLSPKQDQGVPQTGSRVSPKQGTTKDILQKKVYKRNMSDDEFLTSLKEKLTWIDFDREMAKMDAWLLANPGRQKTRRFIVNWLGKVQKPLDIKKPEPSRARDVSYEIRELGQAMKEGLK